MLTSLRRTLGAIILISSLAVGQTQSTTQATTASETKPTESAITQIRKSVAFIRLTCTEGDKDV